MPRQRVSSNSTDYSRHTIEDRPEEVDIFGVEDADGNLANISSTNKMPAELDASITEDIRNSLNIMICEQMKTNEYLSILTGVEL